MFESTLRDVSDLFQGMDTQAKSKEAWGIFLELDQDLRLAQFDNNLPWSHNNAQIKPHLVQLALARLTALKAPTRDQPSSDIPHKGGRPTGRGGGGGGSSGKVSEASEALKLIPARFRQGVCLQFYTTGRCSRAVCKFAAAHKCLLCQSEAHGTASCPAQ